MRRLNRVGVLLGIMAIGFMIVSAQAMTPDGETPAEETVCDVLIGATPGLYGLCVAYCEAHDAHILSPGGDPAQLDPPNRKILENYNKRKKAGDPDMPCIQSVECPCWTVAQLDELQPPILADADKNYPDACTTPELRPDLNIYLIENFVSNEENLQVGTTLGFVNQGLPLCFVNNYTAVGPDATLQSITEDEHLSCLATLIARAQEGASDGIWSCFP